MVSIKPGTKVKVDVPKAQISYMVKNSKYTYEQMTELIKLILQTVLDDTKKDLELWIESKVPKRTGQLRAMLKLWLGGSNVTNGIMRLVMGTNLEYAEDVAQMTTSQVRHHGEKGYVYYPNIFGIRGKVILNDPQAIGYFWDKMIEFAKDRVYKNLIRAKNYHLGNMVKRAKAMAAPKEVKGEWDYSW